MYKKIKIYRKEFLKLLYGFKRFSLEDAIVIYSEPRSGSTWLMEIIHYYSSNAVINWEPLDHIKGVLPSSYNVGWRKGGAIDKQKESELLSYFEAILTAKKINNHTLKFAGVKELFNSKKVITKFVRAHKVFPLLLENFPNTKFIYLQRHPLACCISQLKNFNNINSHNIWNQITYSAIPEVINLPEFEKDRAFILNLNTYIEREIAIWCFFASRLENKIQFENNNIFKVYYEELVDEPMIVLGRMNEKFKFLNLKKRDYPFNNASKSNYKNTYHQEDKLKNNLIFDKWELEKLEKIQAILDYFNYKTYSAFSALPRALTCE